MITWKQLAEFAAAVPPQFADEIALARPTDGTQYEGCPQALRLWNVETVQLPSGQTPLLIVATDHEPKQ